MARRYVPPDLIDQTMAVPADRLLPEARTRAAAAAAALQEAERADPMGQGWDQNYEAASRVATATARRVDALESLHARQVERGGQRAEAVAAAAQELDAIAAGLAVTRDAVSAAALLHLRALAGVTRAAEAHNAALAKGQARVAELGLRVADDLVADGVQHPGGTLSGSPGIRVQGTDWKPIQPGGVVAHALRLVFAPGGVYHPFAKVGEHWPGWRPWELGRGLKLPTLKDAGVAAMAVPPPRVAPPRMEVSDLMHETAPLEPGGFQTFHQEPGRPI